MISRVRGRPQVNLDHVSESKRAYRHSVAEAPHGVWTPIFRNLSNCEQSPLGHRFNLSSDVKERCSSGGAAVYSYTGKVVHPPAAPHLVSERVHATSQAPVGLMGRS